MAKISGTKNTTKKHVDKVPVGESQHLKEFKDFLYKDLYNMHTDFNTHNKKIKGSISDSIKSSIENYFKKNNINDDEKKFLLDQIQEECSKKYYSIYNTLSWLFFIAFMGLWLAGIPTILIPFMVHSHGPVLQPLFNLGYVITGTAVLGGWVRYSLGGVVPLRYFKEYELYPVIESLQSDLKDLQEVNAVIISSYGLPKAAVSHGNLKDQNLSKAKVVKATNNDSGDLPKANPVEGHGLFHVKPSVPSSDKIEESKSSNSVKNKKDK